MKRNILLPLFAVLALFAPAAAHATIPCSITFRVATTTPLGNLQWTIDYALAPGDFVGSGTDVDCTSVTGGLLFLSNDIEASRQLNMGFAAVSSNGKGGTFNVAQCNFDATTVPLNSDFVIHVTESGDTTGTPVIPEPTVTIQALTCDTSVCGNGILEGTEACDDNNLVAGDCCSPTCTFEAAGSACGAAADTLCDNPDTCDGSGVCKPNHEPDGSPCDDSDICTADQCVLGSCESTPITNCPVPVSIQSAGDGFGSAVALSPNYLVVGAPASVVGNQSSGRVHVFKPSADGYTELTQASPIPLPFQDSEHPTGNLQFGASVAVDGQTIVVGAPFDLVTVAGKQSSGSASVFVWNGTQWSRQAKLLDTSELCTELGTSVAISGDTVVVGAPGGDCALVFQRTGSTWSAGTRLDAGVTGVRFGRSVDVSGTAILVGAPGLAALPGPGCTSQGAAYVFRRTGALWALESSIDEPVDSGGGACFGSAVAIDGATGVIGAPADDSAASNAGAAYVTEPTGAVWNLTAKLLAFPTQGAGDGFGAAVDIKTDLIVVGAPGIAAYLFHRSPNPSPLPRLVPTKNWDSQRRYGPPAGPSFGLNKFGFCVAVASGITAIGAPAEKIADLDNAGAVYPGDYTPELPPACGDGHTTAGESCDDGDTSWAPGQHCNALCHALLCGDPNNDGQIKVNDALFVLRTAVGLTPCDLSVCDVNNSQKITVSDALAVLRKAVGLSVLLSCP